MKRRVRLSESKLHRIIKESVKRVLNEAYNTNVREERLFDRKTNTQYYFTIGNNWVRVREGNYMPKTYYYDRQNWMDTSAGVEVAPDFGGLTAEDLGSIGVKNPEEVIESARRVGQRRQEERKRKDQEAYKKYKETHKSEYPKKQDGNNAQYDREAILQRAAEMIKGGYRPNNLSGYNEERVVDELLRRGMVSTKDVKFVYGDFPRFYGGYDNIHQY